MDTSTRVKFQTCRSKRRLIIADDDDQTAKLRAVEVLY